MPNKLANQESCSSMDGLLCDESCYEVPWSDMPDNLLLSIFQYLSPRIVLNASLICRRWHSVAYDELLWKDLFHRHFKVPRSVPLAPGKTSWRSEFRRLMYCTPRVESEVIDEHKDQVLHVSFSHNGQTFSTTSKDGFVKVWKADYPCTLKYYEDMRKYTWKYTQFSQYNCNDTLLLVSGVHFGSNSTSGEIAVFNLINGFELQCRVLNKPYDIFGAWFNSEYLISGNLRWRADLTSSSELWLNKAHQAFESEHESVVKCLYQFLNQFASSIRTVMIARCHDDQSKDKVQTSSDKNESTKCGAGSGDSVVQFANNYTPSESLFYRQHYRLTKGQRLSQLSEPVIEPNIDHSFNEGIDQNDSYNGERPESDQDEIDDANSESDYYSVDSDDNNSSSQRRLFDLLLPPGDVTSDDLNAISVLAHFLPNPPSQHDMPATEHSHEMAGTERLCENILPHSSQREMNGAEGLREVSGIEHSSRHSGMPAVKRTSRRGRHDTPCQALPAIRNIMPHDSTLLSASYQQNDDCNICGPSTSQFSSTSGSDLCMSANAAITSGAMLNSPEASTSTAKVTTNTVSTLNVDTAIAAATADIDLGLAANILQVKSISDHTSHNSSESLFSGLTSMEIDLGKGSESENNECRHTDREIANVTSKLSHDDVKPHFRHQHSSNSSMAYVTEDADKWLIFTTGDRTYTPHKIGIKRISSKDSKTVVSTMKNGDERLRHNSSESMNTTQAQTAGDRFDAVDHVIELNGHIIGMCLSPDHRYLYVNSRAWPPGCKIEDPLTPPPISSEIDIHIIDLNTKQEVGNLLRSHKAFTPNDECFFIFLDVSDEYVASGAEDKHGYLWDRHYGVCLERYRHLDVVNSVAFNPADPHMLVTVSDDHTFRIWRSKERQSMITRDH